MPTPNGTNDPTFRATCNYLAEAKYLGNDGNVRKAQPINRGTTRPTSPARTQVDRGD